MRLAAQLKQFGMVAEQAYFSVAALQIVILLFAVRKKTTSSTVVTVRFPSFVFLPMLETSLRVLFYSYAGLVCSEHSLSRFLRACCCVAQCEVFWCFLNSSFCLFRDWYVTSAGNPSRYFVFFSSTAFSHIPPLKLDIQMWSLLPIFYSCSFGFCWVWCFMVAKERIFWRLLCSPYQ